MPSRPPIAIRATDCQYFDMRRPGQSPASTNAGIVNTAPAATDSPMDPMVRAMSILRLMKGSLLEENIARTIGAFGESVAAGAGVALSAFGVVWLWSRPRRAC